MVPGLLLVTGRVLKKSPKFSFPFISFIIIVNGSFSKNAFSVEIIFESNQERFVIDAHIKFYRVSFIRLRCRIGEYKKALMT
jgi:energy-coupling factor transporter transmembrane protein EcfT